MKNLAKLAILVILLSTIQLVAANRSQAMMLTGRTQCPPDQYNCTTTTGGSNGTSTTKVYGVHTSPGGGHYGMTVYMTVQTNSQNIQKVHVGIVMNDSFQQQFPSEIEAPVKVVSCPDPEVSASNAAYSGADFIVMICTEIDDEYCESMGEGGDYAEGCPFGEDLEPDGVDLLYYYCYLDAQEDGKCYCIEQLEMNSLEVVLDKEKVDRAYRRVVVTGEPQVLYDYGLRIELVRVPGTGEEDDQVVVKAGGVIDINDPDGDGITGISDDVSEVIDPDGDLICHHHHHHHHWHHKHKFHHHHHWHHRCFHWPGL